MQPKKLHSRGLNLDVRFCPSISVKTYAGLKYLYSNKTKRLAYNFSKALCISPAILAHVQPVYDTGFAGIHKK